MLAVGVGTSWPGAQEFRSNATAARLARAQGFKQKFFIGINNQIRTIKY